jgi:hypothetical protein
MGYDDANQLADLTYSYAQTTLETLTYGYDAVGIERGGNCAVTGLPQQLLSSTYDAANQIANWGGRSVEHDSNGNLVASEQDRR